MYIHLYNNTQLAGAQVKRSLVGHGVVLGDGSRIEHCVVGIRAVVGRSVHEEEDVPSAMACAEPLLLDCCCMSEWLADLRAAAAIV